MAKNRIKCVKIWDCGWRLALLKEGRKWAYYITLEIPTRRKRVKVGSLSYTEKPDLFSNLCERLSYRSETEVDVTQNAYDLIHEALDQLNEDD